MPGAWYGCILALVITTSSRRRGDGGLVEGMGAVALADRNPFTVVLTRTLGATVVAIGGEVDGSTAEALAARLDAVLASPDPPVDLVVDLRGTAFIDTTGLNVLVRTLKRSRG